MKKIDSKLIKELREKSGSGFLDCKKALEACGGNLQEAVTWLVEKGKASAKSRSGRIAAEGAILTKTLSSNTIGAIVEINCETDFVAKNTDFLNLTKETLNLLGEKFLEFGDKTKIPLEAIEDLITSFSARSGEKISLRRFEFLQAIEGEFIVEYTHTNNKFGVLLKVKGVYSEAAKKAARGVAMHVGALNPKYALRAHVEAQEIEVLRKEAKISPVLVGKPPQIQEKILEGLLTKSFSEFVLEDQSFAMETSLSVSQFLNQHSLELVEFIRFEVAEGIEKPTSDFAAEVLEQIK